MHSKVKFVASILIGGVLLLSGPTSANEKYKDASRLLVNEATTALDVDNTDQAQILFERALVADPANLEALIGLGKTHEAQGRIGRGLKYYRQALAIDPNAHPALEAQAVAFLKRDMVERAQANRDKLAKLCSAGCRALDNVVTALEGYQAEKSQTELADAGKGRD